MVDRDLEVRYKSYKKKKIIKSKNEILDFTIKCEGVLKKYDERIYADSQKLVAGKKEMRMENLKTMYVYSNIFGDDGLPVYWLKIVTKNFLDNGMFLNITDISREDAEKIDNLFKHFTFSNESKRRIDFTECGLLLYLIVIAILVIASIVKAIMG